jgi:hypothetical protein
MKATDVPPATDLEAEFDAAITDLMNGVRDPRKVDEAVREMDGGREEIRARLGTLDVAVALTREGRDERG